MRARIRSVVDPITDEKRFTTAQVDNWQSMDVLTVLDVFIEPNATALVDGNSLVAALENIELVPSEFFVSIVGAPAVNDLLAIHAGIRGSPPRRKHSASSRFGTLL